MTTYHDIQQSVERLRRRPKTTSTNATSVRIVFGDEARKQLPIPQFIDDYNLHMGGVDIADQLRGYYNTQLRSCHNWYPRFFWLLETTIVNSYIMQKTHRPSFQTRSHHFIFQERLSSELIRRGQEELEELSCSVPLSEAGWEDISLSSDRGRIPYISKHSTAPSPIPVPPPSTHQFVGHPTRTLCILCCWKRSSGLGPNGTVKVRSVNTGCQECAFTLCRSCFSEFHAT